MNCLALRKYYSGKYYYRFGREYPETKITVELVLLKRLLKKYTDFTILEAIDRFLNHITGDKASILYFGSQKVFESKFKDIIRLDAIIKYKRLLPFYNEYVDEVGKLIQEFASYANALSLSNEDISRRIEIVNRLEEIDAERIRRKSIELNQGTEVIQ